MSVTCYLLQLNESDSHTKFPSKSCPLRYGTAKIQEDALILFQAGLREYLGSYINRENQCSGWRITGLSISASKIVAIPSVSLITSSVIITVMHLYNIYLRNCRVIFFCTPLIYVFQHKLSFIMFTSIL